MKTAYGHAVETGSMILRLSVLTGQDFIKGDNDDKRFGYRFIPTHDDECTF